MPLPPPDRATQGSPGGASPRPPAGASPGPWRLARIAIRNAVDFVYPRLCLLCDAPCAEGSRWLCDPCIGIMRETSMQRNACPRCSQNRDLHTCSCELVWDHPFERIQSFFDFDDRIRRLVHGFKYQGKRRLAYDVGRVIGSWVPAGEVAGINAIIAIPLHLFRRLRRGYNQAEWLARGIAAGMGREDLWRGDLVRRMRHTRTQTKLDREARARNLARAFVVPPQARPILAGKRVLLVDDVITTGATTAACAQALLSGGAASVSVMSLARD